MAVRRSQNTAAPLRRHAQLIPGHRMPEGIAQKGSLHSSTPVLLMEDDSAQRAALKPATSAVKNGRHQFKVEARFVK